MEKILAITLACTLSLYAEFAVKSYQEIRNHDLIRQNYEESCGAASLATLINVMDAKTLTELDVLQYMSNDQAINTDMVTFAKILETTQKMGYKSASYQINREALEKITIPLLVKIEDDPRFPHFVIILNAKGDYITIFDPSYGKYTSHKEEFFSVWDPSNKGGYGIVLVPHSDQKEYQIEFPQSLFFEKIGF